MRQSRLSTLGVRPPAADECGFARSRRLLIVRVAFLFNHDQSHQVAHSLPIALALGRACPSVRIVLAVGDDRLLREIEHLGGAELATGGLAIHRLATGGPLRRLGAAALRRLMPAEKVLRLGANLSFFRDLDALVVSEKTALLLRTHHGLEGLPLIHTRHGAGDRAIGFDRASAGFDLVLVSGEKIARRLVGEAGVPAGRIRVVGYPKFDLPPGRPLPFARRDDQRPVILYNPHVSPRLSSWYRFGPAVLDWFVRHPGYRLIVAPHVSLFSRSLALSLDPIGIGLPGRIAATARRAPNIHIDLGSSHSTDMTYTEAADVYLGDVSSQVYEFIRRPRPCLFLDAHRTAWAGRPDYLHWTTGEVLHAPGQLGSALGRAADAHACHHAAGQRRLFADTFSLNAERSSDRAAAAIADFLSLPRRTSWPCDRAAVGPSPLLRRA